MYICICVWFFSSYHLNLVNYWKILFMFGTSKYLILSLSYCKYTSIIISKCIEYWSETESYIANMIVLILHFEEEPDLFPALGKKIIFWYSFNLCLKVRDGTTTFTINTIPFRNKHIRLRSVTDDEYRTFFKNKTIRPKT